MRDRRSTVEIWRTPLLLAALTSVGLLIGLLGDGLPDLLSWLLLAVPVGVCVWALWLRPSPGDERRPRPSETRQERRE